MGDNFQYFNAGGELFAQGELADPGATPGDVLTVQDDGSIAAEAGGGSQPYTVVALTDADTPYTANSGQFLAANDDGSGEDGLTINLPAGPAPGDYVSVVVTTNPANQVEVTTTDETEINSLGTLALTESVTFGLLGDAAIFVFDGTSWDMLSTPFLDMGILYNLLASNEWVVQQFIVTTGNFAVSVGPTQLQGDVLMYNLPSADPHVAGQLYANAGAVMISGG